MQNLVLMGRALADPTRVRILAALRDRELCVCELCDSLAVTQSTLSTHLQEIREAALVVARKEGKWVYYAISPDAKRLVDALFRFFSDSVRTDARLRQDARKLAMRLSLRDNGACCVGFAGTKPLRKETR
ncbi:MAG: metalloregulator ArsR/SmtB family transcription factor [Verrucomicrobiales bacterium]|nr:metalloregulator ArsR/SmtB family transcription factor [Verrucomicrobiales bacterium]